MWIERLEIQGFKRLSGMFDLDDGITVVVGPNESGKSSLHEALIRSLYGFPSRDRRKSDGASMLDRTAPWNRDDHGVVAVVRLRNGDVRRAAWRFADHRLQLTDPVTGDDLTSAVAGKRQDYALGATLLGVELDEFRQVCCLDQAAIGAVERSGPLQLLLQRAVETGDGEAGVDDADKILRAFLSKDGRIGVRIDTLRPLPGGALDLAEKRIDELEAQLADADRSREEVERLAVELAALRDRRSVFASALAASEQQLLRIRARRAEEQRTAARDQGRRANADVAEPTISEDLETRVRTVRSELATTRGEQQDIEPAAAVARERLAELERDRLTLEPRITQLDPYEHVDDASGGRVHELLERRTALREDGDRQGLDHAAAPGAGRSLDRRLLAASLVVGLVSVGLAAVVSPVALVGLAVAALIAVVARLRNVREAGAEAERESRRERTASMRAQADRDLENVLDAAGASPSNDLDLRARTYLDACEKKRARAGFVAQLAPVRADAAAAGEPLRIERQLAERADRLVVSLLDLYHEAAIDATSLDEAGRRFDEVAREARAAREAATRSEAAAAALDAALAGRTLDDLEAEAEQARRRLQEHVERHGEFTSPGDETVLETSVEADRTELTGLDQRSAEIEGRIETLESLNQSPAELKEDLEYERARAIRLRDAAEAVNLAREMLEQSAREAYRRVAPHLKHALERNLPRITGGRYTEATVDDQLQIRVVPPETSSSVDVENLSRGTQDQIYFLERLALARLLDRTIDRPPLLLDDPFVHFDVERRRFALELLVEAAADGRQVILFSTDMRLAEEARDLCDCRVIELPAPDSLGREHLPAGALVGGAHE